MVPAESAAALNQMGTAQQHQHSGIGDSVRSPSSGAEQGVVSRKLLDEEQALGREGQGRSDLRLGDSRRAAPQGRYCGFRKFLAPPGPGDSYRRRKLQIGKPE